MFLVSANICNERQYLPEVPAAAEQITQITQREQLKPKEVSLVLEQCELRPNPFYLPQLGSSGHFPSEDITLMIITAMH